MPTRVGGSLSYTPESLLGEFDDPEMESSFCVLRLSAELENVRRTLFGVIVAMVGVAALDASLLRGTQSSVVVLAARGVVGLIGLLGLWLLHARVSRGVLEYSYVGAWAGVTLGLSVVAVEQGHGVNQPWQVFYFAAAALVAFLPCRLRVGLAAAGIVVLGSLGVSVALMDQTHYVAHIIVGTFGAFAVGYAMVLNIERLLRRDYMRGEQLRADRAALEQTANALRVQLTLAQQAHALGVLAAGTTHDFNNMLMAIRANALSVRDSIAPTAPLDLAGARDASQDILEAVDSASDLSRRLLTFGKPNSSQIGYVNFDQAAQRVLHMMQRLVPKRITLEIELRAGNRIVAIQGTHLEQIVSNLIVNAIEAVPSMGRLRVTTRYDADADRVELCVADDGPGMSAEQVVQVFEPFFTTKATGNGLGLPTVKLLVEESKGEIEVDSKPGQGTSVYISLPVAQSSDEEVYARAAVSGFVPNTAKKNTA